MNNFTSKRAKGFTLVELMISIALISIITAVALPNFNQFITNMRVDNEISALHRLLLTARNTAINLEQNVTVCPLNASLTCDNNWQNELTVFIDIDGDGIYESAANETIVKVKGAIQNGDELQYGINSLIYAPTGRLSTTTLPNAPFSYCPADDADSSRGVVIMSSGRFYQTADTNNDGKDQTRAGDNIVCT